MPIRYVDRRAFVGNLAVALDAATSLAQGTSVAPPGRTGQIAAQLTGATGAIVGGFTPSANRTGSVQAALAGASALIQGTFVASGGSSVILTWDPPTQTEGGSAVNPGDIASYILQAGTYSGGVTLQKTIAAPATSHQWVDSAFASGTWYFRVITVFTSGAQSLPSAEITKVFS